MSQCKSYDALFFTVTPLLPDLAQTPTSQWAAEMEKWKESNKKGQKETQEVERVDGMDESREEVE